MIDPTINKSVHVQQWIEERRAHHGRGNDVLLRNSYEIERETELGMRDAFAIKDAHNMFPRALDALNAVLEQVERMEIDAKTYGAAGHDYASESLATYAGTLRQAIEGAINNE